MPTSIIISLISTYPEQLSHIIFSWKTPPVRVATSILSSFFFFVLSKNKIKNYIKLFVFFFVKFVAVCPILQIQVVEDSALNYSICKKRGLLIELRWGVIHGVNFLKIATVCSWLSSFLSSPPAFRKVSGVELGIKLKVNGVTYGLVVAVSIDISGNSTG